ncbi:MAG: histidine kinase [Pseudoxanthomonas sp.]
MLGLAELAVAVVALAPAGPQHWDLARFLSASGLALWQAVAVSALLCVCRGWLSRLPVRAGAGAAVLVGGVVAALSAAALHMLYASLYAVLGQASLVEATGFGRFVLGNAAIALLLTASALRYFYVSDRWAAQLSASARAEAEALQARIRPHFLFNSMNLIASLLPARPDVAERAVLDLSDLFRAALAAGQADSTLAEEVELAERYLAIESLRLGQRLQVHWHRAEPLPWDLALPRLVLQPLVENAVLHGVSRLAEGGTIEIELRADEDLLHLHLRNPAPAPGAAQTPLAAGAGHAQRSIAHRLGYRFGPRARVTGLWAQGYYDCEVTLPLRGGQG